MNIAILGLGAIGSRVAIEVARALGNPFLSWSSNCHIDIVDSGKVELKNVYNQVYLTRHIGQKKATIVQYMISDVSSIETTAWHNHVDETNISRILRRSDLVIDCLDNANAKLVVAAECVLRNISCLHVGMNVGYGGIRWNSLSYTVSDDDGAPDVCTSDLNPSLAQLVAAATISVILRYVFEQDRINLSIGIENFSVIAS